ncbi:MAG TPA: hypothetical protein VIF62_02390 [Labilithrix sp.]|jgi:hypothetical protein
MRTNKLFHVLVIAGGALGVTACSSADENPPPNHQSSASQLGDADAGEDAAANPTPPAGNGSGSHFW